MIMFECMSKIRNNTPPIVGEYSVNDKIYQYSDYCFVKNKYGYTVARYLKCLKDNSEWWDDTPSIHPLNESDEWCILSNNPIFSFHIQICTHPLDTPY